MVMHCLTVWTFLDKPEIKNKEIDEPIRLRPGDSLSLNCTSKANPNAANSWSSPSGVILPNGTERMKVTEVNEVTDDVRGWVTTFYLTVLSFNETADQGEFSCSVSNNVGVDTYSITVQEACRYFLLKRPLLLLFVSAGKLWFSIWTVFFAVLLGVNAP